MLFRSNRIHLSQKVNIWNFYSVLPLEHCAMVHYREEDLAGVGFTWYKYILYSLQVRGRNTAEASLTEPPFLLAARSEHSSFTGGRAWADKSFWRPPETRLSQSKGPSHSILKQRPLPASYWKPLLWLYTASFSSCSRSVHLSIWDVTIMYFFCLLVCLYVYLHMLLVDQSEDPS